MTVPTGRGRSASRCPTRAALERGRQAHDYTQPDWTEFTAVIAGSGPCNAQRVAHRRRAHEDGAWMREAAQAYARSRRRGQRRQHDRVHGRGRSRRRPAARSPPAASRPARGAGKRRSWPLYEVFVRGKRASTTCTSARCTLPTTRWRCTTPATSTRAATRASASGWCAPTASRRRARRRRTRSSPPRATVLPAPHVLRDPGRGAAPVNAARRARGGRDQRLPGACGDSGARRPAVGVRIRGGGRSGIDHQAEIHLARCPTASSRPTSPSTASCSATTP